VSPWGREVCLFVVALGMWATLPHMVHAQRELFQEGNRLYQQGDFAGAIAAYEAVLGAGFESPALHYNLGNAYFKGGALGRSILAWERALALSPGDADARANLELARGLTADAIQPLPRFWLFDAVAWWVGLLPRPLLVAVVGLAWLLLTCGLGARILARREDAALWATRAAVIGAVVVVIFGTNLLVRELGLGRAERGIVLADIVSVRSAPSDQDDLTLFEIHEGTRVRIDQRMGEWAEIVLDDGKVGWVRADVFEVI
jgi:tetratricopeptide (TPR) repeat protein